MSRALGIYIHVPFCKQKCVYCDFYSLPRREDHWGDYVHAELSLDSEGYISDRGWKHD